MIPKELEHLPVDPRGFAIPYFVSFIDGKPEFRLLDISKQYKCIADRLCAVCGRKLPKDSMFFIGGILTFTNRVCTDPGMHRICAEYSLMTCPHMYYERAQRREKGLEGMPIEDSKILDPGKPKQLYLIKASKYKAIPHPHVKDANLIRFAPMKAEIYAYEDGELFKTNEVICRGSDGRHDESGSGLLQFDKSPKKLIDGKG